MIGVFRYLVFIGKIAHVISSPLGGLLIDLGASFGGLSSRLIGAGRGQLESHLWGYHAIRTVSEDPPCKIQQGRRGERVVHSNS
jgi:hypothetical protein